MWRKIGLAATFGLLLILALGASLWSAVTRAGSTAPAPLLATETTPGLVVQGHVWLDHEGGTGVPGVAVYRSYAAYPGTVVATTGADGFYQSDYYYIPGDEMVSVWAERAGYSFQPELYFWRHYYGYEVRTLDFVATALHVHYLPLVLRGSSDAQPR